MSFWHSARVGLFVLALLAGGLPVAGAQTAPLTVSLDYAYQYAYAGTTVELSCLVSGGSGDKTYTWTQASGTPTVDLVNADQATATFTAPEVASKTMLTFGVTVLDASGSPGVSRTASVRVYPAAPLKADAGANQAVEAEAGVTLGGVATGGSGTKSYAWTQTGGSPTVVLSDANQAIASFTAPAVASETVLKFTLTVTAGSKTATDTMNVTVSPLALSAEAGPDRTVMQETSVALSGSATGGFGTKSYAWAQTGGSPTVTLGDANQASASFMAPAVTSETVLGFTLTVTAGSETATDTVNVTVSPPALSVEAGPDRTVASGVSVTLSGSAAGGSGAKSYAWTQTEGSPTVTLGNAGQADTSFTAPPVTVTAELEFTLTATAGSETATDTVSVTVAADLLQVTAASLVSRPRSEDTYKSGETMRAQVWLSGLVEVSGSPQLALGIGTQTRTMSYVGLARTQVLEFEYTVQASDADTDGVSLGSDALGLPSGTSLTSEAGGIVETDLTGHAISNAPKHKVDGSQSSASPLPDLNACPADSDDG